MTDTSAPAKHQTEFIGFRDHQETDLQRIQELFLNPATTFEQHRAELSGHREIYVAELLLQLNTIDVPRATKIMALLTAFELRDAALITTLFSDVENYGLPEVIAVCRTLDYNRRMRSLARKLAAIRTPEVAAFEQRKKDGREDVSPRRTASRGRGRSPARGRGRGRGRGGSPAALRKRHRDPSEHEQPEVPRRITRAIKKLKAFELETKQRTDDNHVPTLTATLCGRNQVYFQQWMQNISGSSLRHYLTEFGSLEMWKELADVVHLNPTHTQMPAFLEYAHDPQKTLDTLDEATKYALDLKARFQAKPVKSAGGRGGRRTSVGRTRLTSLDGEAANLVKHRVPYTLLRKLQSPDQWPATLKAMVAAYTDLTTVFWWIEELKCPKVEEQIIERLQRGELPKFGYGKLMERLMWCNQARSVVLPHMIPFAEKAVQEYTLPLKTPMAVLGDCSGSMQVAVRTASIIVSLLTALGSAELFFFNRNCVIPPFVPRTILEAIMCSEQVIADGSTSPAAALEPLFLGRRRVETLVVITDEQENDSGPKTGLTFAELYARYRAQVAPTAFLVLVSFLGPSEEGQMATEMASRDIPFLQCRLSRERPDLTKLDLLLCKLSMETSMHHVAAEAVSGYLATKPEPLDAAREIKAFVVSFVREGTAAVVHFIRRLISNSKQPEHFRVFVNLLTKFLATLQATEAVACALSKLTSISTLEELQRWCDEDWGLGFTEKIAMSAESAKPQQFSGYERCGTLTPLPREVLDVVMSYLPVPTLKTVEGIPQLCSVAREAKFFKKLTEPPSEFETQMEQIRGMGLLEMFAEDVVISTLKSTKGNVDHCIALLFGEGRRR